MIVTKYEHACLIIEEQGKKLVIDPGMFATTLPNFSDIIGVVITHEHQDHLDVSLVKNILATNPSAEVMTLQAVADQLPETPVKIVAAGSKIAVGPFDLQFYGGEHALIHQSIPRVTNVGVMINQTLYYPGDSFTPPDQPAKVLALPINAPWMKIGEALDFLARTKPQTVFPTHNAFLSDAGQALADRLISAMTDSLGSTYQFLAVGEQLEIS